MRKKTKSINKLSRRDFLRLAGLAAGGAALQACAGPAAAPPTATPVPVAKPPAAAGPAWATAPTVPKPDKLYYLYWPWGKAQDELIPVIEKDWGITIEKLAEPNVEPMYNKANTMYAAGEQLDVVKTLINWLGQWIDADLVQPLDGLPGLDDYKKDMNELCLKSMEYQGKTWGLPYYQSFYTAVFLEDHFEEGGITAPPTSWEELVDQALKLKQDGVAEYPILWMAGMGTEHLGFEFFQLVYNWGGTVFDQDANLTVGPGSKAREALTWWQKTFQEWKISAPESLELRFIPASKAFWTGKYSFHLFTHHYYMSLLNSETESPIRGRVHQWLLPNGSRTLGWTELECMGSTTASREWAWMLLQGVGGKMKDGTYRFAKYFAINSMLGSGYDVVNRDPEVKEAWKKWTDVDLNLKQWEKAVPDHLEVPGMLKPWFAKWQDVAQVALQDCLSGKITPDEACDRMIAKHKELVG